MHALQRSLRVSIITASTVAALLVSGCGMMGMSGQQSAGSKLSGAQEVPPVSTQATGKSTIKVADDRSVNGSVTVDGMAPTAAHIHQGAAGTNGPVAVPLEKASDKTFNVPASTKLTDAQYSAYKAGNLYVNVHSATYPNGEIRMQMKP